MFARVIAAIFVALSVAVVFLPIKLMKGASVESLSVFSAIKDLFGGEQNKLFGVLPTYADTATLFGKVVGLSLYAFLALLVFSVVFGVIAIFNGKKAPSLLRATSFFFTLGVATHVLITFIAAYETDASVTMDIVSIALFAFGALVYFVAVLVSEYFDWTVPMNSPLKVMQQIAAVCAMLYLCAEMMQFVGKDRPHRLTACAALAAFFGLANGASLLLAFFVGGIVRIDYAVHAIPALAVGVYALIRLLNSRESSLPAPAKEEPVEAGQDVPAPEESEHSNFPEDLPTTNDEEN